MRLLIVTNDYPPKAGGIQMYLKDLVEAYPEEVHVVAPNDPPMVTGVMAMSPPRGAVFVRRLFPSCQPAGNSSHLMKA